MKQRVCMAAVAEFGWKSQVLKSIEELTELSLALQHRIADKVTDNEVITEIADVSIMLEQLKILFGRGFVGQEEGRKLERLDKLIKNN